MYTYMPPWPSFEVIMCPTFPRFYSQNYDQLETIIKFKLLQKFWSSNKLPVATKLHEPRKTKSVIPLLWHGYVCGWITREINLIFRQIIICKLTKKDRLHCEARPACHKLKLPSPSAMPNLLPCCENRHLVTLAKVPGDRGVQTACWWPHSHICTEPSWLPVKYSGISGWAHIRLMLSTLCFSTLIFAR